MGAACGCSSLVGFLAPAALLLAALSLILRIRVDISRATTGAARASCPHPRVDAPLNLTRCVLYSLHEYVCCIACMVSLSTERLGHRSASPSPTNPLALPTTPHCTCTLCTPQFLPALLSAHHILPLSHTSTHICIPTPPHMLAVSSEYRLVAVGATVDVEHGLPTRRPVGMQFWGWERERW
ncbi:hypothetical protein EVG20_g10061 [Dentipellis fragilis]|uniref:Uncharacterized protein n=1 Tax=Dentipellis fragilis TaxID=205917 RepID=A0A4Y9XTU9_9AGAM|nr:hypothetical protein EVG20_g10061 [Dentipellis fragilis]